MTIEVDFDLSFAELYGATLSILIYVLRYLLSGIVGLGVVAAACFALGARDSSWSPDAYAAADWLFIVLIGSVPTVLVPIPITALVRTRQMLKAEGGRAKRRYVFSDEEITIRSEVANASVKWAAYGQVRETSRYFLLYSAPGFANVVPKRYFPSPDSVTAFRNIVRAHARKFSLRE